MYRRDLLSLHVSLSGDQLPLEGTRDTYVLRPWQVQRLVLLRAGFEWTEIRCRGRCGPVGTYYLPCGLCARVSL